MNTDGVNLRAHRKIGSFSGPTLDASNDFLFDLQKKQVEKNLTLDLADEDIFSNPESQVSEQAGQTKKSRVERTASISVMDKKEFFSRPQVVSYLEDEDEVDGTLIKRALRNNPEMNSKFLCFI